MHATAWTLTHLYTWSKPQSPRGLDLHMLRLTVSRRMAPKANISFFIDTIPRIVYSGAIYALNGQRKIMEKQKEKEKSTFMKCTKSKGNIFLWNNILHCACYETLSDLIIQHHRELKINNLRIHIRIQEDVAWFQIFMDNTLFM